MKELLEAWGKALQTNMFEYSQKMGQEAINHEMLTFDKWYEDNIEPKYSTEEYIIIAKAMMVMGGSFVTLLGRMLLKADWVNREKLAITFKEYFEKYLKMGR